MVHTFFYKKLRIGFGSKSFFSLFFFSSFVRPHLDYCDVIFHVPHKVGQLGLSLSNTMEEIEKVQKLPSPSLVHGKGLTVPNSMRN